MSQRIHVFCEEPLALQNGKTTRTLGLAAGALWAQHIRLDLMWHWVNVSDWKKMVGKDKSKDAAAIWANENLVLPTGHLDEDHYDAACVGEYGRRLLGQMDVEPPSLIVGLDTASDRWHAMVLDMTAGSLRAYEHKRPKKEHIDVKRKEITIAFGAFLSLLVLQP